MNDIRLSEAIRLGAMMAPQGFGDLISGLFRRKTCAIGAALSAVPCDVIIKRRAYPSFGFRGEHVAGTVEEVQTPELWNDVFRCRVQCPDCKDFEIFGPAHRIIAIHLNDKHRWTREQIADWVETIERQLGQVPLLVERFTNPVAATGPMRPNKKGEF